eukprot:scaffold48443_cov43-Phaeocystis_antarctica.AAC.4
MAIPSHQVLRRLRLHRLIHGVIRRLLLLLLLLQLRRRQPHRPRRKGAGAEGAEGAGPLRLLPHREDRGGPRPPWTDPRRGRPLRGPPPDPPRPPPTAAPPWPASAAAARPPRPTARGGP